MKGLSRTRIAWERKVAAMRMARRESAGARWQEWIRSSTGSYMDDAGDGRNEEDGSSGAALYLWTRFSRMRGIGHPPELIAKGKE